MNDEQARDVAVKFLRRHEGECWRAPAGRRDAARSESPGQTRGVARVGRAPFHPQL